MMTVLARIAVVLADEPVRAVGFEARDLGEGDLDARLGGLIVEALAELDAGDRLDDAGHVLDVGGVEYLAAGHHALDEEAAQTGAARMDGGGEAGDPATDDDRVVRRVGHCVHRVLPFPSAWLGSVDILQLLFVITGSPSFPLSKTFT